jgi:hypothetical protein
MLFLKSIVVKLKNRAANDLKFYICSSVLKNKRTNPMEYLDFELPIKELEEKINVKLLVKNQMLMLQLLVSKSTKAN